MLSDDELFSSAPLVEKVPVRGKHISVRGMTGTERDLWEQHLQYQKKKCGDKGYPHFRASLVIRTALNAEGTGLRFTPKDTERVSGLAADILSDLYDAGARLSGVTKEDAKELGEGSTESEGSTSD